MKESAARKEALLQEKARQLEAAQAALDAQVQEAVQEAIRKLQEDQLWFYLNESNPSGGASSFNC